MLVHDDDFGLATVAHGDDVVHITLEQVVGTDHRHDVVDQIQPGRRVQAFARGQQTHLGELLLDQLIAGFGDFHRTLFFVDPEVPAVRDFFFFLRMQFGWNAIDCSIQL